MNKDWGNPLRDLRIKELKAMLDFVEKTRKDADEEILKVKDLINDVRTAAIKGYKQNLIGFLENEKIKASLERCDSEGFCKNKDEACNKARGKEEGIDDIIKLIKDE